MDRETIFFLFICILSVGGLILVYIGMLSPPQENIPAAAPSTLSMADVICQNSGYDGAIRGFNACQWQNKMACFKDGYYQCFEVRELVKK